MLFRWHEQKALVLSWAAFVGFSPGFRRRAVFSFGALSLVAGGTDELWPCVRPATDKVTGAFCAFQRALDLVRTRAGVGSADNLRGVLGRLGRRRSVFSIAVSLAGTVRQGRDGWELPPPPHTHTTGRDDAPVTREKRDQRERRA